MVVVQAPCVLNAAVAGEACGHGSIFLLHRASLVPCVFGAAIFSPAGPYAISAVFDSRLPSEPFALKAYVSLLPSCKSTTRPLHCSV